MESYLIKQIYENLKLDELRYVRENFGNSQSSKLEVLAYIQLGRQIFMRLTSLCVRKWSDGKYLGFLDAISVSSADVADQLVFFNKSKSPLLRTIKKIQLTILLHINSILTENSDETDK